MALLKRFMFLLTNHLRSGTKLSSWNSDDECNSTLLIRSIQHWRQGVSSSR
jgi:hypothetical protein